MPRSVVRAAIHSSDVQQEEKFMPLNLTTSEGEFTPFIKYNAKAGRFYVRPDGGTEDVEITNPTLAIDLAYIKTGWIYFADGAGPEKVWDPSNEHAAPRPSGPKKFKRGFEVQTFSNALIPGTQEKIGLREFSSTANNVIEAIKEIYAKFEGGAAANRGKVPVFHCTGVKPVEGTYGTNYKPLFELKQWVDRSHIPPFDEVKQQLAQAPAKSVAAQQGRPQPKAVSQQSEDPAADMDDEIPF
jgi:hypothetical protein